MRKEEWSERSMETDISNLDLRFLASQFSKCSEEFYCVSPHVLLIFELMQFPLAFMLFFSIKVR